MAKPLWKILEDGGVAAYLEYGLLDNITKLANCASYATNDLLYWQDLGLHCSCYPGLYNNTNNVQSFSEEVMRKRFTADLMAGGAKFLGLGENIPKVDDDHYLIAAFCGYWYMFCCWNYLHIRQHRCGTWTQRQGEGQKVSIFAEKATKLQDLLGNLDKDYTIFKGWFAIPKQGMQSGIDQAVFQVYNLFSRSQKLSINNNGIKDLVKFYKEKNNLLNNCRDLKQLGYDFEKLSSDLIIRMKDNDKIINFFNKYNVVKYPQIINSPGRDPWNLSR